MNNGLLRGDIMTGLHSKAESFQIFDSIANRYDFINSVLSFGLHGRWRRALLRFLPQRHHLRALDLATGTGDVALTLIQSPAVESVDGVDMSEGMLALARAKVAERGLQQKITMRRGDAQKIDAPAGSYDLVTISFGIRNVASVEACLQEGFRVLRPGGRMLVLEFGLPETKWLRSLHLFYLRNILPIIGRIISGHSYAYKYLNETIEEFPYGSKFVALMKRAGFAEAGFSRLTFGSVHLYWGEKH